MIEVIYNADGTTSQREIPDIPVDNTEETLMQIQELKTWFDTYYKEHFEKYTRLIALGKLTDEGTDTNEELLKLYNTAETKRNRIQKLEGMLNATETE